MADYKGSIELISGIKPKNNGTFPLVNARDVQVDDTGKRLDTRLSELANSGGGGGSSGADGEDGATFTPSVSSEGVLSWTNDKGLTNPDPVNIKGADGAKGDKGDPYTLTEADKAELVNDVLKELPLYKGEYEVTHYSVAFTLNQCYIEGVVPTLIQKDGQTCFNIRSDNINATGFSVSADGATVERLSGTGSGTSLYASYKLSNPTKTVTVNCAVVI